MSPPISIVAGKRSPPPEAIPFIESRFFDPNETGRVLQERFERHLRTLRARDLPKGAWTGYLRLKDGSDVTAAEADVRSRSTKRQD
ncbi:MAG: hypothetical protein WAT09_04985 [Paracoccaceae bacterium]